MRIFRYSLTILLAVFVLSLTVSHVEAVEMLSGKKVTVPEGQTIQSSLFASGSAIEIDGTVDGDLICASQNVIVRGTVTGDVICAAQTIVIEGEVQGDARLAAQTITIEGFIDRNLTAFAQNVTVQEGGFVGGDAMSWAQTLQIDGAINRQLFGGMQTATINGTIAGDVNLYIEDLIIGSEGKVGGNLVYTSPEKETIADGAVAGVVTYKIPPKESPTTEKKVEPSGWLSGFKVFSLIGQALFVFLLIKVLPKKIHDAASIVKSKPLLSTGIGLLIVMAVPIIVIVFLITIVGIPLAVILLSVYVLSFFVGRAIIAVLIGRWLLERFWTQYKENDIIISIVGVLVMWLLFQLPIIGGLFWMIATLMGFGGVYYLLRSEHASHPPKNSSHSSRVLASN